MRTVLYNAHVALGAKMVDFAGWEMPLSYRGVVAEHLAVRTHAGLFDVSHMGRIRIQGPDAEHFLNFVTTNEVIAQLDGSAAYTVLTHSHGGTVDDTLLYRFDPQRFYLVANACNREKDLAHLRAHARSFRVTIQPTYANEGILALQGPEADTILRQLFPGEWNLKYMRFAVMTYQGHDVLVARTGYTGSGGYELFAENSVIPLLWTDLLAAGCNQGLEPVGIGARDTLRLEAGYSLYGHELADAIAPTESVSAWAVKWKKGYFVGQEALLRLQGNANKRSQHGVVLSEPGVPRANCRVFRKGVEIGLVTSGTHSPCLNCGIAIVMVQEDLALGEGVEIEVRGRKLKGQVIKLPFYNP